MKIDDASSPVPDEADGPGETISHGDGALELEPPEEGATLESPPDGGLRAWLIVLACTGINALLGILRILIQVCLLDVVMVMSSETGIESDTLGEMSEQFIALSDVYAPLAAFVMIFFGYRATICIGASVVMTTLIILSYLGDDDTENFIKFLLYGPTAIGMSFIQLGALIPVLEYFTTKRMKALFLSKLGNFVGEFILMVILIEGAFTGESKVTVEWRDFLRGCSGLCIGIGLLGLTLKELKLKMKDDESVTFVQRTLGLTKKDILRNVLLWSTCAVYFFYQWGIVTPQGIFADQDTTKQLSSIDNLPKALFYGLSPILGLILGMFLAWMFKKAVYDEKTRFHVQTLKADRMNIILGILVVAAATMGIGCFIAPHAETFGYFFPFSLVFATFFAFCEGLRDDAVPDEFGRENVRIVEGLILMFAGLGGIITNEIGSNLEDATADENEDDWKKLFRYGGGMLLLSSIVTALVLFLKQSKTLDKIQSEIDANTVAPLKSNVINVLPANGKPELKMQSQDRISGVNNQNNTRQRNGNVDSSSKQEHNVTRIHSSRSNKQRNAPPSLNIGYTHSYQQQGVSPTVRSNDTKPYQLPGVPSTVQSEDFKRNQHSKEGLLFNPSGGFKSNQQPGVPSSYQSGGFKSNQQTREPSPDQSGGFKSNQQSDQSGVFHPYQQRGVLLADHNAVSQPEQRPGLSSLDQIGVFHHNQQREVPSADQNGVSNPDQRPNVTHH
ncbi:uncharacterized protein LOC128556419 [Mercenaria mercenaria]|uniref:uncharacterized protein LOC128556419 n=1 Tax=Mercenaria mercenaria TaxID=6596 RepID=UPI00234F172E|nr:uncharacterized protein LOC128556419 [Mercenaria mercenaria]